MTQQRQETVFRQKNPLRIEQEKRLVEYNHREKEELKNLNEQITKQDHMVECKPVKLSHNYLYIIVPWVRAFELSTRILLSARLL